MLEKNPRYDVAISFLSSDESIAAALYRDLSAGLEVFFYPHAQKELAGTDGLESMRTPFLYDSRLVVVLYRERWGNTPWTGVEQTAIQDRCLSHGWRSLFFMMLDGSTPPVWLPNAHVRFNFSDFGLAQAVGAIKARVQEAGGAIQPISAVRRAEMFKFEQEHEFARRTLRLEEGRSQVKDEFVVLFDSIKHVLKELPASGDINVEIESRKFTLHLRNEKVSILVSLEDANQYPSRKAESIFELAVRHYNKRRAFLGEHPAYFYGEPKMILEVVYLPDINRARHLGWTEKQDPTRFRSTIELADEILIQFVNLFEKAQSGAFDVLGGRASTNYRRRRSR